MEKKGFQRGMDWHSHQPTCSSNRLENIEEENPASWFPMTTLPPPETPTESMEFLARSWSLSSIQLSEALRDAFLHQSHSHAMETAPCSLGMKNTSATSSFQLAKVSTPNPIPTMETEDVKVSKSMVKGKSVGRWLKDRRVKNKEEIRTHNAQLHAATSAAGLAAAVAAILAPTSTSMSLETQAALEDVGPSRRSSAAVVSAAAALVASYCVEIAEEMGANRDRILTAITSAVNIKTRGDIMTLTAGAATALRGAAALRARLLHKETIPPSLALDAKAPEDVHVETCTALNFVTRGGELLKRTRKGVLHWKQVSFYMNSNGQVIIKMKSKHIAGTFVKKKKSVVFGLCCDVPAWDGRDGEDGQQKPYFGIQTADRLIEFECRDKHKQMWIDGIQDMLQYRGKSNDSLSL